MGFFWLCPCGHQNFYSGSKTTDAVTSCSSCKKSMKVFQYRKVVSPTKIGKKQPKTTDKLPTIKMNGMVGSLVIALNYAINTIKNKKEVLEEKIDSTWYQHYKSWTRMREYFQKLEEDK